MTADLSEQERRTLLELARASLSDAAGRAGSVAAAMEAVTLTPNLEQRRATFVTLKAPGPDGWRLRGCIGTLEADEPLYRAVIANARRSAVQDPRFSPVTLDEADRLRIEISVLTRPEAVARPDEVVVGRDGVELERPPHRAVFLPQVAPEQGWNRTTLLEHLALKAGLPRTGWRDAMLRTFRAEVFGED